MFLTEASSVALDDGNGRSAIAWSDSQTGETRLVSVASDGTQTDTDAWVADIRPDGRFVVFIHAASNRVPGDANGYSDDEQGLYYGRKVFVRDRKTN